MPSLMRWEPFRDTEDFFRSFLQPGFGRSGSQAGEVGNTAQQWMPAVDIRESDAEYTVLAEMPGIRREDVKVRVEDDVLTLEGERNQEHESGSERTHRVERLYGRFRRRFTLPEDANAEKISADCKDGVVTVHIPKRPAEKRQAREISVQ